MGEALSQAAESRLSDPGAAAYGSHGTAVAISGDTVLVGAPGETADSLSAAGVAYIYVRAGAGWSLQATLTSPQSAAYAQFGDVVALSGGTAVIGDAGRIYVFVRTGSTWAWQATLMESESGLDGAALAVSGDTVVVGNRWAGAAHIFARSGTVWTQQAKLVASASGSNITYGSAVGIEGDTVIVGDPGRTVIGDMNAGEAYVYRRSGTEWLQQAQLTGRDVSPDAGFGSSVALAEGEALIGAPYVFANGQPQAGEVDIFSRSDWTHEAVLTASDAASQERFGMSVTLSGEAAVIGAQYRGVGGNAGAGSAYVYTHLGSVWSQQAILAASDGAAGDFFGSSVALAQGTAVVGAPYKTVGGEDRVGAAYCYALDDTPPTTIASGLQASQDSGWLRSPAQVNLAAAPGADGAGVATTYYAVDGGSAQIYAQPFTLTGSRSVTYWSVDVFGLVEAGQVGYVKVDATPPTTTASRVDGG